jgi:hypothetical protein
MLERLRPYLALWLVAATVGAGVYWYQIAGNPRAMLIDVFRIPADVQVVALGTGGRGAHVLRSARGVADFDETRLTEWRVSLEDRSAWRTIDWPFHHPALDGVVVEDGALAWRPLPGPTQIGSSPVWWDRRLTEHLDVTRGSYLCFALIREGSPPTGPQRDVTVSGARAVSCDAVPAPERVAGFGRALIDEDRRDVYLHLEYFDGPQPGVDAFLASPRY